MNYLVEARGIWFDGSSAILNIIQGSLVLLPIVFPGQHPNTEMLFREDYFNSATRVRRGRLYRRDNDKVSWATQSVFLPHGHFAGEHVNVNRCYTTVAGLVKPGSVAVLGDNGAQSHWVVVFSEKVGLEAHYLTLKSKTYFGVLPEIDRDAIPEANRQDILQALDAVVEAAPIQAPQPVIDACRNAACHMITAKFPESNPTGKKDLGDLVTWLLDEGKLKSCTDAASALVYLLEASCSHLINRLHTRAKANAAAQHGTRAVSQQDANLAVDAIAFLLQDFGWAETRV